MVDGRNHLRNRSQMRKKWYSPAVLKYIVKFRTTIFQASSENQGCRIQSLGILAHLLRMISWNLNTMRCVSVIVEPQTIIILWQTRRGEAFGSLGDYRFRWYRFPYYVSSSSFHSWPSTPEKGHLHSGRDQLTNSSWKIPHWINREIHPSFLGVHVPYW